MIYRILVVDKMYNWNPTSIWVYMYNPNLYYAEEFSVCTTIKRGFLEPLAIMINRLEQSGYYVRLL